jgi:NAD(P) transhydrogenase
MSPMYDFDLVCIGSGPAGQRAAIQAAKLGQRAAVVEKRHCVGGVRIETGTIPSTVFNYPPLAECYKMAALDASNKLRA